MTRQALPQPLQWRTGGESLHGKASVDRVRHRNGKERRVNACPMDMPFISGRAALDDAALLIETYGDDAMFEAAMRAEDSRDKGNVTRFCHWRQIERVIVTLSEREVRGTVH